MALNGLSAPSAYALKKDHPEVWEDLVDRIAGALLPAQLDEIETDLEFHPFRMPVGWYIEAFELIDKRRDELRDEDLQQIMWDRHDFT
jgi:hypothetical protein